MLDYKGIIATLVGASTLAIFGYLYAGVEEAKKSISEQAVVNKTFELEQKSTQEAVQEVKLELKRLREEEMKEQLALMKRVLELQLEERRQRR